jgi:hypothetical protein
MKVSNILHRGRLIAAVVSRPEGKDTRIHEVHPWVIDIVSCLGILCQHVQIDPLWVVLAVVVN